MLNNNLLALILTFAAVLLWLRLNDYAAARNWTETNLSRKLIHLGSDPIFFSCWLLFDGSPNSRYLAALVPFAITVQFAIVGGWSISLFIMSFLDSLGVFAGEYRDYVSPINSVAVAGTTVESLHFRGFDYRNNLYDPN